MHSRGDELISIVNKCRSKRRNQGFAEVHDDILFLILEKLEWIDRIRAKTVCKKWLQVMLKITYQNQGKFPWLFSHISGPGYCKVKLTDECSKRSYIIEQSGQQHLLYNARVCASKFVWILMVSEERNKFDPIYKLFNFFVYCPFNYNLINLPTFSCDVVLATYASKDYTFSSNPTLSDCVFFALFGYSQSQTIEIRTCRIGDEEWTYFQINMSIPYVRFSVECVNGLLYVVLLLRRNARPNLYSDPNLNSHVGIFDVQKQEWKLIKNEKGFLKSTNRKKVKRQSLLEQTLFPVVYNNKELYLFRRMENVYDEWEFFKYDMEEKQWVEQSNLGNRVLFIGASSFLVDAVSKLSSVANHVFMRYAPSYPFSFSSGETEYHRQFYVDDKKIESRKFCQSATWIMPTV